MWTDDRLLPGYRACAWQVADAAAVDGEPDEPLTATLVRRNEPEHDRALLYVHGWNDYFFQTHLADYWNRRGFDFYAIDLRRYGRNLRPGLFAGFCSEPCERRFGEVGLVGNVPLTRSFAVGGVGGSHAELNFFRTPRGLPTSIGR